MIKKIKTLLIALLLSTTIYAQEQKVCILDALQQVADSLKLEICYCTQRVNLKDSIALNLSQSADSCLQAIKKKARLTIEKTSNQLIISPAQHHYLRLQGKIIDSETKESLPYANLLIADVGTGTITNQNGWFDFKVSNSLAGSKIQFSFLGYHHEYIVIPNESRDSIIIEMRTKSYTLSDVYVLPNGTEAVDILKKAVKYIKRNYHRKKVQYDAFYRNISYRDSTVSHLIEAALLIEDRGIGSAHSTTKIKLQEVRKSENYLVPNSAKWKVGIKLMENAFGGHRNIFYRAYFQNMVRNYRAPWWYQPLTDYKRFKYEFAGFTWLDSTKVYKIKYTYDVLYPNGKRASENKNSDDGGFIYISAKDWGILKIEQHWRIVGTGTSDSLNNELMSEKEISYQKYNGKYYLKHIRFLSMPDGKIFFLDNPDASDGQRKVTGHQWSTVDFMVSNIVTNSKEFDRIKYREVLDKTENSYEQVYPYHPKFWENYNLLKTNSLEEKAIQELEWEKPLSKQFKENSDNDSENP